MSLDLTTSAALASQKVNVQPQYVLTIEGVSTVFGAIKVLKIIRLGDPGLVLGGGATLGGLTVAADSMDIINLEGSSSSINQQLQPDKGSVSSVSSLQVALLDHNLVMSGLISPGVKIADILARKAKLYMGFANTAFPEDHVVVFSGIIDDVESSPGNITLNIAHPDQKKRQEIFQKTEITLSSPISPTDVTMSYALVDPLRGLPLQAVNSEDLSPDTSFKTYIRIEDEIVGYTSFPFSPLTITRGELGTTAASHAAGVKGESFVVLEGDLITLALKLMMGGNLRNYINGLQATSFNWISADTKVSNAIFFSGVDLIGDYGVTVGDYIYTHGATNTANTYGDFSLPGKRITDVQKTTFGSYVVVAGVSFVDELATPATVDFQSKYASWKIGLGMTPDQIDVAEHLYWYNLILNSYSYRFYMKDAVDGKDFLETQIYAPFGAYSIPRKGRASMGFHIGPVPRGTIPVLNKDNVRFPDKIRMKRTINRNFYNTIGYSFDQNVLDDKLTSNQLFQDSASQSRIPVGSKVFRFDATGVRTNLSGPVKCAAAASRMLGRYKYGAEYFESVQPFYKTGFTIEPGDIVLFDPTDLKITNTKDGTRTKPARFFEVVNKSMNLKTGDVSLSLVDTNFDSSERYGIVSPASIVVSGTTTYAIIQDSYGSIFPGSEKSKWDNYIGLNVLVHDPNFVFSQEVTLTGFDPVNPYKMLFGSALASPVQAGWVIDIPNYPTSTNPNTNRAYKLFHASLSPQVDVTAGVDNFTFTVSAGDIGKFHVGLPVRVHSVDFTTDSGEVIIGSIVGNNVTATTTLGFTPSAGQKVSFIGFADSDQPYRYI